MKWLERTFSEHLLISGDVPPRAACLKNLEADPRYRALLRKMGLPG